MPQSDTYTHTPTHADTERHKIMATCILSKIHLNYTLSLHIKLSESIQSIMHQVVIIYVRVVCKMIYMCCMFVYMCSTTICTQVCKSLFFSLCIHIQVVWSMTMNIQCIAVITLIPLQHSQYCLMIYFRTGENPKVTILLYFKMPTFRQSACLFPVVSSITSCFHVLMYYRAQGGLIHVRWAINKPAEEAVTG